MGFLDGIFGKGVSKKQLSCSELGRWLDDEEAAEKNRVMKLSKPALSDISSVRERMKDDVLRLAGMPVEDAPPRLRKIVRTSKPEYISTLLDILGRMQPEAGDFKALTRFRKNYAESLEKIAKAMVGHGRYLPYAYGDAFALIQRDLKALIEAGRRLGEAFEPAARLHDLEGLRALKDALEKKTKEGKSLKARKSELKKALGGLESSLHESEKEYAVKADDKGLEKIRDAITDNAVKRELIRSMVHGNLMALGRPLRKYQRIALAEKRLSSGDEKLLEALIDSPVDCFLGGADITGILAGLEKALEEGKVEVKNPQKVLKTISELKINLRPSVQADYAGLLRESGRLQKKIEDSGVETNLKKLEHQIAHQKTDITSKHDELKTLEKKLNETEAEISTTQDTLKTKLKEHNITLLP